MASKSCKEFLTVRFSNRFQIVPVSCERLLKFCYRHIFHHFHDVPASCECSLNQETKLLSVLYVDCISNSIILSKYWTFVQR